METPIRLIDTLLERAEAYGNTSLELSKLKTLELATSVITLLASKLIVLICLVLSIIVASIGLAIWLGEWAGHIYYGLFMVALLYLFASVIMHFFLHGWISKPLSNLIISKALEKTEL